MCSIGITNRARSPNNKDGLPDGKIRCKLHRSFPGHGTTDTFNLYAKSMTLAIPLYTIPLAVTLSVLAR